MKLKRLLACALALTMCLSLVALPAAAAAAFPDIEKHWAKENIEEMIDAGMFKGYPDGTFLPEKALTGGEALALCARAVGLDEATKKEITADRAEQMTAIFAGKQDWYYTDFSVALETGILTYNDLRTFYQAGNVTKEITREDLSKLLVRAMQMGPMAERMTTYDMDFKDVATITEAAKPFVYVLKVFGVVQGDQFGNFTPKGSVKRGEMATMLVRALKFMDENAIVADLPDYTNYDFSVGVITSVTTADRGIVLLTLKNELDGTETSLSLPTSAILYENSRKTDATALKAGRYARVCLDGKGAPTSVRISTSLTTVTGTVSGIENNNVALSVSGEGKIVVMDRFTRVKIGSAASGDRSKVDAQAGYTAAVCQIDDQGRLVTLHFTGGTRQEDGIFSSIEKAAGTSLIDSIRVIGFDGVTRIMNVPTTATILINGRAGTFSSGYAGSYLSMRVSNDNNSVTSATVDTVTKYVQGVIKGITALTATGGNSMSIANLATGKTVSYNVAKSAELTYDGEGALLSDLKRDQFITAQLLGEELVRIDAYPGSAVTEGIVTSRTFGTTSNVALTIEVTQANGVAVRFPLDLTNPPEFTRAGEKSNITKLAEGDQVVVTTRYDQVTQIVATPQEANVVGIIESLSITTKGTSIVVTLASGESETYDITTGTAITQNGKEASTADLKPGFRVGLVVNGTQVASIQIQQTVDSSITLNGSIISKDAGAKTLMIMATDEGGNTRLVTVHLVDGNKILEWNGTTLSLSKLETGDSVQLNGTWKGADFMASLVLRKQ